MWRVCSRSLYLFLSCFLLALIPLVLLSTFCYYRGERFLFTHWLSCIASSVLSLPREAYNTPLSFLRCGAAVRFLLTAMRKTLGKVYGSYLPYFTYSLQRSVSVRAFQNPALLASAKSLVGTNLQVSSCRRVDLLQPADPIRFPSSDRLGLIPAPD